MWLCNKDKVKLIGLEYIPSPRDKFKYVLFHAVFEDDLARDTYNWFNDCIHSVEGLQATVVLTGWIIKYHKGFGLSINVDDNKNVEIKYIDKTTKLIKKDKLNNKDLPLFIQQALDIIFSELIDRYGVWDSND